MDGRPVGSNRASHGAGYPRTGGRLGGARTGNRGGRDLADHRPNEWGAYDDLAFQVTIGWPGDAYLTAVWARLSAEGRQTGPSQWALTEAAGPPRVIADHGDFLAEAKAYGRRRVPVAALIQAVANLHPVTVDAIMAGGDQPA